MGSQFETIFLGRLCNLKTKFRNACATVESVNGWVKGMKCPYLVNLSPTIKMVVYSCHIGKPFIKSIDMYIQAC